MSSPQKLSGITVALLLGSLLTACSPATAPEEQQEERAEVVEGPTTEDETAAEESPAQFESPEGIPFSEVEARSSRDNCWIVVLGDVYDFTLFVQQHPFGTQLTNAVCGKDATETFQENTDINEVVTRLEPLYLGPVGNG